ncbi:hypothetical protein [Clostridium sp.]|uniref:hypothetical protein n=1 Tax=Clostridium sp. TaxID=1506 RepID=UPI001A579C20|nr:hypothetical protein [Clostridium sp.]MBK5236708.1 hypothetical protein [Clostridium sp.]
MKRIYSLFIIIFSTLASVTTMVSCDYSNNSKQVAEYNKVYVPKISITNDTRDKEVKKNEDKVLNTKDDLDGAELFQKKLSDDYKSEDNKNSDSFDGDVGKSENSLESYYNYIENEQSVFKVSTGKIQENLTTSDKIKLLYVSMKLGREDYKKVKEYLYAVDAEEGVLDALKLLKEDLSKNEYEKVRKIAGRFIDMDAAESQE